MFGKNLLTSCLEPPFEENKAQRVATVTDGQFLGGTWKLWLVWE